MKSEFVRIVSHDLRSPLTFVKGYAGLMMETEGCPLTPQQRKHVERIIAYTNFMAALIDDLLDLGTIEDGLQGERIEVEVSREGAGAGDEVVLRDGDYRQGEISLPHSGTSGAPSVIRGYGGETATLDGGDPATFTWTAQGGGVYRATVNEPDTHLVVANGERLYPYQSLSDLQSLRWGIPGFYADGMALYVRLYGDANPNSAEMIVSRYNNAFYVNERDFIYFLNLTFRHYGQGSWAKAIYFNNSNNNLVSGCTFAINDLGIGIKRVSHRNVTQDSEFYDTDFDWPWDAVKGGSSLETGGVGFYDPATGQGNVIRRNTFHDYFDGLGICPSGTAGLTNETDFYENLIYRAGDDGIEQRHSPSATALTAGAWHFLQPHAAQNTPDAPGGRLPARGGGA